MISPWNHDQFWKTKTVSESTFPEDFGTPLKCSIWMIIQWDIQGLVTTKFSLQISVKDEAVVSSKYDFIWESKGLYPISDDPSLISYFQIHPPFIHIDLASTALLSHLNPLLLYIYHCLCLDFPGLGQRIAWFRVTRGIFPVLSRTILRAKPLDVWVFRDWRVTRSVCPAPVR